MIDKVLAVTEALANASLLASLILVDETVLVEVTLCAALYAKMLDITSMVPIEVCRTAGKVYLSTVDADGKVQIVDPFKMVVEEQQIDFDLIVVLATQDPIVVAFPDTLQPTVGVIRVAQDNSDPTDVQETVVLVAVALEHSLDRG